MNKIKPIDTIFTRNIDCETNSIQYCDVSLNRILISLKNLLNEQNKPIDIKLSLFISPIRGVWDHWYIDNVVDFREFLKLSLTNIEYHYYIGCQYETELYYSTLHIEQECGFLWVRYNK